MHHLTDKKKRIYFYIIFLIFLSSVFNFEVKKSFNNIFQIKKIDYTNNELDIKIEQYLNRNIFTLDKKEITSLINTYPVLNSFKINKVYPSTLKVNLIETKPIVKLYVNGKKYYIGENGKIFSYKNKDLDLPIIKGYVEIDRINKFLEILKASSLNFTKIDYLVYQPSNRWDILLKDNTVLKLPIKFNFDSIKTFDFILNENKFKKKVIDLRIKNKLIISNE